jgi:osmotically-inducible protein OsmY
MRRLVVGLAFLALAASTFSWALADDQEIARKVKERLTQEKKEGNLRSFDINLKVVEGKVTLKGSVASAEQKELAVGLARQVDGVKDIQDELQVKAATVETSLSDSGEASSATPTPARKTLLSNLFRNTLPQASSNASGDQDQSSEPDVSAQPASPSASAPDAAAAKELKESQAAADRRIGEKITRQLQQAKDGGQLKGFGMSVHVDDGYVWLKGRVGSAAQQQMALELARRTDGVRQVINELTINESASNIAQNLNRLLQTAETEGTLRGAQLTVKVDGPDVWLTGTINNPEQEQVAVDLARKVPGVRRVISGVELNQISAASLASPAPTASLLPPVAISAASLNTAQAEPTAGVRFTKQAEEATLVAHASPVAKPSPAEAPVATSPAPTTSVVPVAMIPAPGAANTAAAGGYVYYNSYPTTQASMPMVAMDQTPRPLGLPQMASYAGAMAAAPVVAISHATGMMPAQLPGPGYAAVPARYDHPSLPGYAWPTYAAHPNYAAVTYPKQYSPSAWPYIGPFYPYPQVPLGWRKVTLKWDDGWWNLDFKAK